MSDFSVQAHSVILAKEQTLDPRSDGLSPVLRRKEVKRLLFFSRKETMISVGWNYI
ncbi:hypothetical protein F2Q70_00009119 [Brassica cretica]|uniref:Uncharacterized protein n=1 Tax=Brassica cretica TaxID=69181 RepID=A0A8S9LX06_BRACR|nr:hypothetical protein F2Q70_00009119 [Brassica cretica]KAF3543607.1 hypothetical protein DY000_02002919 [Brassica cretica]